MTSAAWRNSISTAWIAVRMIATMPRTSTAPDAAPVSVTSSASREPNWPPVDTCSTHEDQASPAFSSISGSSTPTADVAAMIARPEPTSISGFALRVTAIFPAAAIIASTATATVTGSSHRCSAPTAGSVARSGDGTLTHQSTVPATIQSTPD